MSDSSMKHLTFIHPFSIHLFSYDYSCFTAVYAAWTEKIVLPKVAQYSTTVSLILSTGGEHRDSYDDGLGLLHMENVRESRLLCHLHCRSMHLSK